jgi:hypothetical protein
MYTKDEGSQLRHAFWTTYGQYMAPVLSADGLRINWVNYKTGVKHIYFKMQADSRSAYVSIDITHTDLELQQLFFEQFETYRALLNNVVEEGWQWQLHATDEYGKVISRIYTEMDAVSIFQKNDWPKLISFFKPRIIALDEFWSTAKYAFEI